MQDRYIYSEIKANHEKSLESNSGKANYHSKQGTKIFIYL
jgi:hypothetical protein